MDYFDTNLNLSDEDIAVKEAAHKFAETYMRPTAKILDQMKPEEVVAADSPLWPFLRKGYELGYHKILMPEAVGGDGLTPIQGSIVLEEMGWGSFGLGLLLGVVGVVGVTALFSNNPELIGEFTIPFCQCTDGSIRGCWAGTEPDHGSDTIGQGEPFYSSPNLPRGNCRAERDGDYWIINGQKSAWVSGGTISTHAAVYWVQVDASKGFAGGAAFIIPMDLPGVSKGKPLGKLGMRDLNQGEIYFDNVRVPARYMLAAPGEQFDFIEKQTFTLGNVTMAALSTGLARAAFEEAFNYCKERVQGGRTLMDHYSIKQRIFQMFARVETCRAVSRAACGLNFSIMPGLLEYSMSAKITATQLCMENANDAIQMLGGNGLTTEYLPEKLFRDARATLICDGSSEVLARLGGHLLFESYPRVRNDIKKRMIPM
jgi:acyl-CoA dehydrogenase